MDLINLVNDAPQINLTVTAGDLREFADQLIEETKEQLEQTISNRKDEVYLTSEQTMKKLNVSKTTLWRWKQRNYLCPIRVGGNERYRLSDINEILEVEND